MIKSNLYSSHLWEDIINIIMPKVIDIEFCAEWGYGAEAQRLNKTLADTFPDVQIDHHSANGVTNKIEVAWIDNGNKNIVWSKTKEET